MNLVIQEKQEHHVRVDMTLSDRAQMAASISVGCLIAWRPVSDSMRVTCAVLAGARGSGGSLREGPS